MCVVAFGIRGDEVVDVGANSQSARRQQMRGGFATKRDAERALRELLRRVDHQRYVEPVQADRRRLSDQGVAAGHGHPRLRETTWSSYAGEIRLNVVPMLGDLPLQALRPADLNKLYAHLLSNGRKDGRGGLSPRTVRYVHTIVRKSLADARRWGRVETNVADLADPPRGSSWQTPQFRTWTATEVRRFLAHVADDRLYAAWLLASPSACAAASCSCCAGPTST